VFFSQQEPGIGRFAMPLQALWSRLLLHSPRTRALSKLGGLENIPRGGLAHAVLSARRALLLWTPRAGELSLSIEGE
jgi:hypothetical protein